MAAAAAAAATHSTTPLTSLDTTTITTTPSTRDQFLTVQVPVVRLPAWSDFNAAVGAAVDHARPWSEFANTSQCAPPDSLSDAQARFVANAQHFRNNYVAVFLVAAVVTVLMSPVAFVGLVLVAGVWVYLQRDDVVHVRLGAKVWEVDERKKLALVAATAALVMWGSGAGSTLVNVAGMVGIVSVAHAVSRRPATESDFESPFEKA